MSQDNKIFRYSIRWIVALIFVAILFWIVAGVIFITRGFTLMTLGSIVVAVIGVLGLIDALISHVALTENSIEIFSNFRKRIIPRSSITSVSSEKGCPTSLKLNDEKWVKLPTCSPHPNTLRAWLKL